MAQPPTPTMQQLRTITVALPEELIRHLDRRAQERGCSRAAFIRFLALADKRQPVKA